jgi:hypothetical protein
VGASAVLLLPSPRPLRLAAYVFHREAVKARRVRGGMRAAVRLHGHTLIPPPPPQHPPPLSLFPTPAQAHSHGRKAAAALWRCLS